MKKVYLLLAVLLSAVTLQAQTIKEGDILLNAGLGLGTYDAQNLSIPPISLSADYTLKDNLFDEHSALTVGGYLGYYGTKNTYNDVTARWSNVLFGGRGAVHYNFVNKLDTYGGLMLGYNKSSHSVSGAGEGFVVDSSNSNGGFIFSLFVGARYFFTEKIGAYAEIGYGVSALELGVTFKL